MKYLISLLFIFSFSACTQGQSAQKSKFLNSHNHDSKKLSKTRGFINLSLEEVSRDETSILLKANISPLRDMSSTFIEWQVPDSAIISEGIEEQNLDLQANQNIESTIRIDKSSLKNGEKIFIFAYKMKDGERHGSSAVLVYDDNTPTESMPSKSSQKISPLKKRKMIQ